MKTEHLRHRRSAAGPAWKRGAGWLAAAVLVVSLAQAAPPRRALPPAPASAPAPTLRPRLDLRIGHTGPVEAVAISPDGSTLASASQDHTLKLWDVATGTVERTLADHTGPVFTVAFSPDGVTLASGSVDHTVKLWDARTGWLLHTLAGHTGEVMALAFAPDRRMLASGGADGAVRLWDVLTGKELPILADYRGGSVVALAFSPDGRTLSGVRVGPQRLEVTGWDLASGQRRRTQPLEGSPGHVRWATFSPDGTSIASGQRDDNTPCDLLLWDAETGRLRWRQPGHATAIFSQAFSSDGKTLASASLDGTVRLWEVETGTPVRLLNHNTPVFSVAFSLDGKRLVSGDVSHAVNLWELPLGALLWSSGGSHAILSVAVSRDGKTIASGATDAAVRLWDARTGTLLRTLTGHPAPVRCTAFSSDGQLLASSSWDGTMRLWDARQGELRRELGVQPADQLLALSPDGKTVVSGADNNPRLWDVRTGALLRAFTGPGASIIALTFSPDGKTVAGAHTDGRVRVWNPESGSLLRTLTGHHGPVGSVAFSPDGKTLASGGSGEVKLWDARTGELLRTLAGGDPVTFSPDGKSLVANHGGGALALWVTQTGELQRRLIGHTEGVNGVAFSPDGKRIISGGADHTVRIWDPSSGRLLATLMTLTSRENEPGSADWLATTPEGYYDSSPAAGRFLRWQLGPDLFPVEAYERSFRRPELLRKLLAGEAITQHPEIRRFTTGRAVPPQVTITRPRDRQTVSGDTLRVEVTVTDDRHVTRVEVRVNGRPVDARPIVVGSKPLRPGAKPILIGSKSLPVGARPISVGSKPIVVGSKPLPTAHRLLYPLTVEVPLPAGETHLTLKAIATDDEALQGWAELHLTRSIPTPLLGDLYVLSIGVSRYQNPRYNLKYAAADATAFAGLWPRMKGTLYRQVLVRQLTDAQATTEKIQSELFKLLRTASSKDTVALFVSGHGVQLSEGPFYFATHDIDAATPAQVRETALPWTAFQTVLGAVHAKRVFLFLDACHSGSALGEQQASNERLAEALVKRSGVLVFASSRGSEVSYEEGSLGHGAFTAALVEGIGAGKADLEVGGERDGKITAAELLTYLQIRVPQLTGNRQTPTCPLLYDFGEAYLLARSL